MSFLKNIIRKISGFFGDGKDVHELNGDELTIFKKLPVRGEDPPMRVKEIDSEIENISRSNISKKLRNMEEEGYTKREDGGWVRYSEEKIWGSNKYLSMGGSVLFFIFSFVNLLLGFRYSAPFVSIWGGLSMFFAYFWLMLAMNG